MVKSIYLQDGEEIFVDDEDYERVNQYTWYKVFAGNTRIITNKTVVQEHLSKFLIKDSFQKEKNNDFTKSNLSTKGNSGRWRAASSKGSSKYKGVTFNKREGKWHSTILLDGNARFLGSFKKEDEAAIAYNRAVLKYLDGNAYINKIGEDNRTKKRNYETKKHHHIKKNKTGYRGVTIRKKNKGISAQLIFKSIKYHLGYFKNIYSAALAYNKCALYLHGDDAILNDVPMTDELKEFIANWEIPDKIKALKVGVSNE